MLPGHLNAAQLFIKLMTPRTGSRDMIMKLSQAMGPKLPISFWGLFQVSHKSWDSRGPYSIGASCSRVEAALPARSRPKGGRPRLASPCPDESGPAARKKCSGCASAYRPGLKDWWPMPAGPLHFKKRGAKMWYLLIQSACCQEDNNMRSQQSSVATCCALHIVEPSLHIDVGKR